MFLPLKPSKQISKITFVPWTFNSKDTTAACFYSHLLSFNANRSHWSNCLASKIWSQILLKPHLQSITPESSPFHMQSMTASWIFSKTFTHERNFAITNALIFTNCHASFFSSATFSSETLFSWFWRQLYWSPWLAYAVGKEFGHLGAGESTLGCWQECFL